MRPSKKEKTQTSEHLFLRLKGMLINMIIQFSKGDIIQMKKAASMRQRDVSRTAGRASV